jgi:hypothetical protein
MSSISFGMMEWSPYPWDNKKSRLFVYAEGNRHRVMKMHDTSQALAARRLQKRIWTSRTIQSIYVSEK